MGRIKATAGVTNASYDKFLMDVKIHLKNP